MGFSAARTSFENAKSNSQQEAMLQLAEGLIQLSRAIQNELEEIHREVRSRK